MKGENCKMRVIVTAVGMYVDMIGDANITSNEFDKRKKQMNTSPTIHVNFKDGVYDLFAATDLQKMD